MKVKQTWRVFLGLALSTLLVSFASEARGAAPRLAAIDGEAGPFYSGERLSEVFVRLMEHAPEGGVLVSLNYVEAKGPLSVTIPAGHVHKRVSVELPTVGSATTASITARLDGSETSRQFLVAPAGLSEILLSPANIELGQAITASLRLRGKAHGSGLVAQLNLNGASGPQTVQVPGGQSAATFVFTPVTATGPTQATVEARYGSASVAARYGVTERATERIDSIAHEGQSCMSGLICTVRIALTGPSGRVVEVPVSTSNNALAGRQRMVRFEPGEVSKTVVYDFEVGLAETTNLTVTAGSGSGAKSVTIPVKHYPKVVAIQFPSPIAAGATVEGTVKMEVSVDRLHGDTRGLLALTTDNPSLLTITPGYYTMAEPWRRGYSITAGMVSHPTIVKLQSGGITKMITIEPPAAPASIRSLTFSPAQAAPGTTIVGRIELASRAGSSGTVVELTGGNGVRELPASARIESGATATEFRFVASTPGTIVITAKVQGALNGTSANVVVTAASGSLRSLVITPREAAPGEKIAGRVTLDARVPVDTEVRLGSSMVEITLPASVTIRAGSITADFAMSISANAAAGTVIIAATRVDGRGSSARLPGSAAAQAITATLTIRRP